MRVCLQVQYLLRGLFARSCKSLGTTSENSESIREEVGQLRGLLATKLSQINTNLEGKLAQHGSSSLATNQGRISGTRNCQDGGQQQRLWCGLCWAPHGMGVLLARSFV